MDTKCSIKNNKPIYFPSYKKYYVCKMGNNQGWGSANKKKNQSLNRLPLEKPIEKQIDPIVEQEIAKTNIWSKGKNWMKKNDTINKTINSAIIASSIFLAAFFLKIIWKFFRAFF